MRTGFKAWWESVSALVSRRITVACERWMRAMDWEPCRADRIRVCMAEGEKMTSSGGSRGFGHIRNMHE
jgi:hypothetical protein